MYDWANSVYSLVISSTIFPIYYDNVTQTGTGSDKVNFFGWPVTNTVLYSYSLSFAFLFIACISPLLSGIADFGGKKKTFMKFFTYVGGISCIALYFFNGTNIEFGIFFATLACIGYAGSIVFYNAYLPVITTPDKYDIVSARGYAMGYIGSVLLLIFNLATISRPRFFGFANETVAAQVSFILVGIWWMGFAQIAFYFLPAQDRGKIATSTLFKRGYQEIRKVYKSLKHYPILKKYLIAFLFYNTGVQTVMYLAALFGDKELQLPGDKLIITVLIIQIVAVGGSYLFARISELKGNKFSLLVMVLIWVFICGYAYFITTANQFYFLAFVVGMVMGGIQSLSRATYSKLIPQGTIDHTSYFSFYDVLEKISIVMGTFAYGIIEQITGSMRNSTLALGLFFMVGMGFLWLIKIPMNKRPSTAPIIS